MSEQIYTLTLTEVTQSIREPVETVITIVGHGIVEPSGRAPDEWLFEPHMLDTLRRATRLQRDLELEWAAVALALNLLDQLQELRTDNRRLRQQLRGLLEPQ